MKHSVADQPYPRVARMGCGLTSPVYQGANHLLHTAKHRPPTGPAACRELNPAAGSPSASKAPRRPERSAIGCLLRGCVTWFDKLMVDKSGAATESRRNWSSVSSIGLDLVLLAHYQPRRRDRGRGQAISQSSLTRTSSLIAEISPLLFIAGPGRPYESRVSIIFY
jgi:hypothetical protein